MWKRMYLFSNQITNQSWNDNKELIFLELFLLWLASGCLWVHGKLATMQWKPRETNREMREQMSTIAINKQFPGANRRVQIQFAETTTEEQRDHCIRSTKMRKPRGFRLDPERRLELSSKRAHVLPGGLVIWSMSCSVPHVSSIRLPLQSSRGTDTMHNVKQLINISRSSTVLVLYSVLSR